MKNQFQVLFSLRSLVIFIAGFFLLAQGLASCTPEAVEPVVVSSPEPAYGSLTDSRDGKVYKTVAIGDQVWMAENLDYAPTDGSIPHTTNKISLSAYCYYNNDSSLGYGCLYTWGAAMGSSIISSSSNPSGIQGICPSGWHLPSISEWTELEDYLILNGYNWDGSIVYTGSNSGSDNKLAKSMASKTGWNSSNDTGDVGNDPSTNNSSGFSALPGGSCSNGSFDGAGISGNWWSSSKIGPGDESIYPCLHTLYYSIQHMENYFTMENDFYSVRCLKD